MRITHTSRHKVRQLIGDSRCALISITTATGIHPDTIGSWGAIYRIRFDDIDYKSENSFDFKLFDSELANGILDFVIAVEPDVLVVSCDAGISRSAGVVVALEQIFNKIVVASSYPLHNRLVATTLILAANKRGLI